MERAVKVKYRYVEMFQVKSGRAGDGESGTTRRKCEWRNGSNSVKKMKWPESGADKSENGRRIEM